MASLTISLLYKYYHSVKDLRTYLKDVLDLEDVEGVTQSPFEPVDTDSAAYRDLVDTSFVALKSEAHKRNNLKAHPPMIYMREVKHATTCPHCQLNAVSRLSIKHRKQS